mmetsp:Transcript_11502/g.19547  ORF Transcript_11502/g.19547 Transcript_11502/m.19547 type:complete len:235 (-) Transcript_11502:765-1469(-)
MDMATATADTMVMVTVTDIIMPRNQPSFRPSQTLTSSLTPTPSVLLSNNQPLLTAPSSLPSPLSLPSPVNSLKASQHLPSPSLRPSTVNHRASLLRLQVLSSILHRPSTANNNQSLSLLDLLLAPTHSSAFLLTRTARMRTLGRTSDRFGCTRKSVGSGSTRQSVSCFPFSPSSSPSTMRAQPCCASVSRCSSTASVLVSRCGPNTCTHSPQTMATRTDTADSKFLPPSVTRSS